MFVKQTLSRSGSINQSIKSHLVMLIWKYGIRIMNGLVFVLNFATFYPTFSYQEWKKCSCSKYTHFFVPQY